MMDTELRKRKQSQNVGKLQQPEIKTAKQDTVHRRSPGCGASALSCNTHWLTRIVFVRSLALVYCEWDTVLHDVSGAHYYITAIIHS
jgi:hypothetical protein